MNNPTIAELYAQFIRRDIDGVMEKEEEVLKHLYGPKEAGWRSQRDFFSFCAGNNASKEVLLLAGYSAVEAARISGETEDYIMFYWYNIVGRTVKYAKN